MQRLSSSSSWHLRIAATAAVCLLSAASAGAQVGTAISPIITVAPHGVYVGAVSPSQLHTATSVGGFTLFGSSTPNGPILARVTLLPPFDPVDPDGYPTPWFFPGVPPGSYYLALVYGIVNAPAIPASSWRSLVVTGACAGAPGVGQLTRQSGAAPNTVQLFVSANGGCATSYLVEAGSTPGAADVASVEQPGVLLSASGVPPGSYYVRVRGRNQFGIGPYSAVMPIRVPDCPAPLTVLTSTLSATVVGQQVTLTWTPPTPAMPVGGPVTYYEIARLNGRSPGEAVRPFLLPGTGSSVSAVLPSGYYLVALYAGNACGADVVATRDFTVP